jgi:hypothetical protein
MRRACSALEHVENTVGVCDSGADDSFWGAGGGGGCRRPYTMYCEYRPPARPRRMGRSRISRGGGAGFSLVSSCQYHGRYFGAEARANKYKTITLECASGSDCPSGGAFQFSPEAQAFNEATFAARGTQQPKRCACAPAGLLVRGGFSLDMKCPIHLQHLTPNPIPYSLEPKP